MPEICDYENSPWRTEFWHGREYEDRAERIALSHMLPPRGTRLCEIGAGFGRLAQFYLGYDKIILIDYARTMLEQAREHLAQDSRFIFATADLYNLPLADSSLDTAVTVRVLHHVTDIPRAFSEISRVVRPQGTYLTEFANKCHLKAILRYWITRRPPNPSSLEPYEFVRLNFDFHPRYVVDELAKNNFVVQDKRAVSTFRIGLLKRTIPANILAALDGNLQSLRFASNLQISPSLFYRNLSYKPGAPSLNPSLWRCPTCGSTQIQESREALSCCACSRAYPILDGIIDFKSQM
ncbi:MAG: methyltransferase domain-containing protein [Chloroflexi bacterium]|nr:methyltransferase domain-containing protein [Chloroflexota bacterium]